MTPTTTARQYAAALLRAHAAGLRIVAEGLRVVPGIGACKVYYVPSVSEPGYLHAVVRLPNRLTCDCMGAQGGRYCQHRALAHERLVATHWTAPAA